jgi:lysosomal Pro-X carboxypeptidase
MVNKSWTAFRDKAKTEEGRQWLNQNFRLCDDSLITSEDNVSSLINWVVDAWSSLAMINYPYPTNFLEPVPGWPVKEACQQIMDTVAGSDDDDTLLLGIHKGVSVFHNNSGQRQCYSFSQHSSGGLGDDGWGFQACTEMVMPMCNNGTDMFEVSPWNFTAYAVACNAQYGVRSRIDWATINYGGRDLKLCQ